MQHQMFTETRFHENGNIALMILYFQNKYHSEDQPAKQVWDENGIIRYKAYYQHGRLHNEKGPAHITFNADGSIKFLEYYLAGKLKRTPDSLYINRHNNSLKSKTFVEHLKHYMAKSA